MKCGKTMKNIYFWWNSQPRSFCVSFLAGRQAMSQGPTPARSCCELQMITWISAPVLPKPWRIGWIQKAWPQQNKAKKNNTLQLKHIYMYMVYVLNIYIYIWRIVVWSYDVTNHMSDSVKVKTTWLLEIHSFSSCYGLNHIKSIQISPFDYRSWFTKEWWYEPTTKICFINHPYKLVDYTYLLWNLN